MAQSGPKPIQQGKWWFHLAASHSLFGRSAPSFLSDESGPFSWAISGTGPIAHSHIILSGLSMLTGRTRGRVKVSVSTKQTEHIPRSRGELTGVPSVFHPKVQNYVMS